MREDMTTNCEKLLLDEIVRLSKKGEERAGQDPEEILRGLPRWYQQISVTVISLYEDYFERCDFWDTVRQQEGVEGVFETVPAEEIANTIVSFDSKVSPYKYVCPKCSRTIQANAFDLKIDCTCRDDQHHHVRMEFQ